MGALDGRVAIITGAGRGIGREHALLFAAEGAKVVVNDLGGAIDGSGDDRTPAQQVVDEIKGMGGEAVANADNVADWEGGQRLVNAAVEAFGDLHVLVNNAGTPAARPATPGPAKRGAPKGAAPPFTALAPREPGRCAVRGTCTAPAA